MGKKKVKRRNQSKDLFPPAEAATVLLNSSGTQLGVIAKVDRADVEMSADGKTGTMKLELSFKIADTFEFLDVQNNIINQAGEA